MEITPTKDGQHLSVALAGRLDTASAPQLEELVADGLDGVTMLVFDFSALDYISSAGLRVLLMAQKRMNKQGSMIIRGANEVVMDVFDVTGFIDILTVE